MRNLLLATAAVAGLATAAPAFAQTATSPNNARTAAPMTRSQSGETAYGFGERSATVGDDARTYSKPGDNGFTAHPRGVINGEDLGPGNDTGN